MSDLVPDHYCCRDAARPGRPADAACRPYLGSTADSTTPGAVLAFAHRGGAFHPDIEGLENTLQAFRHAVGLGYDYLETDVHVTSDGVLLAFHDTVLDRVTDAHRRDRRQHVRRGAACADQGLRPRAHAGRALRRLPRRAVQHRPEGAGRGRALARFLEEREAWDRVCVGSFSGRRLRRFRRLTAGRVATSASPGEVAAYRLLPAPVARLVTARPHRACCRSPTGAAGSRSSRRDSYDARTGPACTCTSGPSTTPTR